VFGFNQLRSGEMPYFGPKHDRLGAFCATIVQPRLRHIFTVYMFVGIVCSTGRLTDINSA
jgi:hypothetical protein